MFTPPPPLRGVVVRKKEERKKRKGGKGKGCGRDLSGPLRTVNSAHSNIRGFFPGVSLYSSKARVNGTRKRFSVAFFSIRREFNCDKVSAIVEARH